jgi:hypothetical protein
MYIILISQFQAYKYNLPGSEDFWTQKFSNQILYICYVYHCLRFEMVIFYSSIHILPLTNDDVFSVYMIFV